MEIEIIDGHEFILDAAPVRQEPVTHQCVCLLRYEQESDGETTTITDKCSREVSSPDQAFCDGCEELAHHLLDTQMGDARNMHRKGKNVE
jgi:hypothetical protein